MMADDILQRLAERSITKEELLRAAEGDPGLIPTLVDGLASPKAAVRYGCARVIIDLSARHPEWLYPHWDAFAGLLGCRYRPLIWGALTIIANLASMDVNGRFEAMFDKYYALLGDGYMVTAANVVGNSAKVARVKPHLADRIAEELLGVEGIKVGPHMTEECRRVVAEQAVEALGSFFDLLNPKERKKVNAFVKRQVGSSRRSLAAAAREFLASKC
jgi:hypothetical protein